MRRRRIDIEATASIAEILLNAGAEAATDVSEDVTRIGRDFEFHRANFNPDLVESMSAGLEKLYSLFAAAPESGRRMHDGQTPISVEPGRWQDQHRALWQLLVPSSGVAATIQGEVIRITGRLGREIHDNGGVNWGPVQIALLSDLVAYFGEGLPLSEAEQSEAVHLGAGLRRGHDSGQTRRLSELAVQWVTANPTPIPLA